ncbi:MAG: hypothetical protein WDN67_01970 [Candidatus Moraniibacteriota bacterium]
MENLGVRPVGYNVVLARLSGKATHALFMSQLLYWHGKGRDKEWFYKTQKDFEEETGLNRSEQDRAIEFWKGLGVLKVKRKGIPQKRHFQVDVRKLTALALKVNAKWSTENADSTVPNC